MKLTLVFSYRQALHLSMLAKQLDLQAAAPPLQNEHFFSIFLTNDEFPSNNFSSPIPPH